MLYKRAQFLSPTQNLAYQSNKSAGQQRQAYSGRKIKSQGNSARDTALSCPIWTDNHIEVRTREKLDVIIGDKVVKLDPNNGSWDVS
jgi:hypothetical protein